MTKRKKKGNKRYILAVGLILVVALLGVTLVTSEAEAEGSPYGVSFNLSESAFLKLLGLFGDEPAPEPVLGAQPGPDGAVGVSGAGSRACV